MATPTTARPTPRGANRLATRRRMTSGLRLVVQLVSFVLFPGLFVEAFSGMRAIAVAIATATFDATVASQALATLLVIVLSLVLGRIFCGWACAFGTIQDLASAVGRRLGLRVAVPVSADRALKGLKYAVLAFVVLLTWTGLVAVPEAWNPWEAFAALVAFPPDLAYAFGSFGIGLVLLLAIMVGSVFVDRLFCRYLCPLGAVLSIVSLVRPVRVRKPRGACGTPACVACSKACPQGIDLAGVDEVRSGECVMCLRCVAGCPRDNAGVAGVPAGVAPVASAVCVAGVLGLYQVGTVSLAGLPLAASSSTTQAQAASPLVVERSVPASAEAAVDDAAASPSDAATTSADATAGTATSTSSSGYADGTYQGSGTGHKRSTTVVQVTISGGAITDVTTVSTGDDAPYYSRAFSSVVSQIVSTQSADVNAVSGATHSSDGIMEAVADALAQASA